MITKGKILDIQSITRFMFLAVFFLTPFGSLDAAPRTSSLTITIFAASDCEGCRELKETVLPPLLERYKGLVTYEHIETDKIEGFKKLLLFEKRYNQKSDEAVRVFIGNHAIAGMEEIKEKLPIVIEEEINGRQQTGRRKKEKNQKLEAFATLHAQDSPDTPKRKLEACATPNAQVVFLSEEKVQTVLNVWVI